ncbi:MAG: hypothetical protein H0U60_18560 [Blastocatellia bacterium]|nr:hypothetical protein [Blastocatellia bacterium]
MYAYRCPTCNHVLIVAGRIIGAGHATKPGLFRRSEIHDMIEVGVFSDALTVDQIKAQVVNGNFGAGVKEIRVTSNELPRGTVRYERAKVKR